MTAAVISPDLRDRRNDAGDVLRARKAGPAIVEEARRRDAELVLLGAPRRTVGGRRALFGGTVDYVLRESPCRVLVAAGKQEEAA